MKMTMQYKAQKRWIDCTKHGGEFQIIPQGIIDFTLGSAYVIWGNYMIKMHW